MHDDLLTNKRLRPSVLRSVRVHVLVIEENVSLPSLRFPVIAENVSLPSLRFLVIEANVCSRRLEDEGIEENVSLPSLRGIVRFGRLDVLVMEENVSFARLDVVVTDSSLLVGTVCPASVR